MLVRALKMLSYFRNETARIGIATAALNQPGDEGCAYGRGYAKWQRRKALLFTAAFAGPKVPAFRRDA
jgi:hypothetical protein